MRALLTFGFWVWAATGLACCGCEVLWAHGRYELGVGTSAAIAMDIALWTGGLVMFGIGAALSAPEPARSSPTASAEPRSLAAIAASVSDAELAAGRLASLGSAAIRKIPKD